MCSHGRDPLHLAAAEEVDVKEMDPGAVNGNIPHFF